MDPSQKHIAEQKCYTQDCVPHKYISTKLKQSKTSLWSEVRIVLMLRHREWPEVTISRAFMVLVILCFLN